MKIAVDASLLTTNEKSGTHLYLYNIIKYLGAVDNNNEYILYFKEMPTDKLLKDLVTPFKNINYKVLETFVFWTQLSLAYELYKEKFNVLFAPWHTMPGFHLPSLKIVATFHSVTEHESIEDPHVAYTARHCNHIISVSDFTTNELKEIYNIKNDKITTVNEGVDVKVYNTKTNSEVNSVLDRYEIRGNYTFFISTFGERKNIENMLRAFSVLVKEGKDLTFVLAGHMPDKFKYILDITKELGISSNVKFLGRVPQLDVPALYTGSMFLSFVSNSEGFGLPNLEAMACGTPVLSTQRGAVPSIVGDAGLLVNPFSVTAIAKGMLQLFSSSELRAKYTERGFKQVEKYSWEAAATKTLEVFKKVSNA